MCTRSMEANKKKWLISNWVSSELFMVQTEQEKILWTIQCFGFWKSIAIIICFQFGVDFALIAIE